jgi:hypothetical protein
MLSAAAFPRVETATTRHLVARPPRDLAPFRLEHDLGPLIPFGLENQSLLVAINSANASGGLI